MSETTILYEFGAVQSVDADPASEAARDSAIAALDGLIHYLEASFGCNHLEATRAAASLVMGIKIVQSREELEATIRRIQKNYQQAYD